MNNAASSPRRCGVGGQAGANVANQNQTADGGGVDRAGSAPAEQASAPGAGADTRLDTDDIFRSIGEVPYDWRLDTDVLQWGPNAGPVLGISDIGTIASGRGFAQLRRPEERTDPLRRGRALDQPPTRARASHIRSNMRCVRRRGRRAKLWVEDTGRWFAGPDGKPLRAHGVCA